MKRRLLATITTVLLAACLIPGAAWAADVTVNQTTAETSGNALLESMETQSATKPDGFDEDTINPYGAEEGEVFTMLEKTDLFSLRSSNINNGKAMNETAVGDGNASTGALNLTRSDGLKIPNGKLLSYMQGVGFDAKGEGRRNYVGIVGYDSSAKAMKVYIIDASSTSDSSSSIVGELTIAADSSNLAVASWVETVNLDTVDAKNFFQITAGDYDGDGRDSLVVYCGAMTGASDGLTEISWNDSSWVTTKIDVTDLFNSAYLEAKMYSSYRAAGLSSDERKNAGNILAVSMDSGDVNGDGVDDLVVISATGQLSSAWTSRSTLSRRRKASIPRLAVAFGSKAADGSTKTINNLGKTSTDVIGDGNATMVASGVSIGDIDGDGENEIAAAGFLSAWKDASTTLQLFNGGAAFAYYNVDGTTLSQAGSLQVLNDISPISKGDSLRSMFETAWQQFSVECVAFDGVRSQEYLFLNGYLYKLSGTTLSCVAKPSPFDSLKESAKGIDDVNENFVYSAAVGNIYGNDDGKEAICLTVGYKENNADDYSFLRVTIRKKDDGSYVSVGTDDWVVQNNGDTLGEKLNCIVVDMDNDRDSVVAKYAGKDYAYSDPNVVAFLQAAPYFSELDPGNSSTTYSYAESFTQTKGSSTELSYNIGATAGVSAGAISINVEAGKAFEMSDSYEESRTTEYTTTFEASEQNQVIVRRTLIYNYNYQIMDSNGQFSNNAVIYVQVPQYPVMTSMSMDQYNEFARAFNDKYGTAKSGRAGEKTHKLDIITDELKTSYRLDNEGNPVGYADNPGEYTGGMDLSNDQWMQLSYAVGTTQQGWTSSLEKTQTQTASDGLYMNMTVETEASILGVVDVSVGVSAGYEKLVGQMSGSSRMTSTSTGGAVQNLSSDLAEYGYGFHWKLIGWKGQDDLFKGVLFVGYAVRGVTAPVNAVEDLSATYVGGAEQVALTWTSPEVTDGRAGISGFKVYRKEGDAYVALTDAAVDVSNTGAGDELGYTVEVKDYEDNEGTFVVRSIAVDGAHDSLYSNEAYCLFALSDKEAQELVSATKAELQGKIDALQAALESGQSGAIAQAVADLTAAYQAADETLGNELRGADDSIRAELQRQIDAVQTSLQDAIGQVQARLDQATADLNAAIAAGDDANSEEVTRAREDLTSAYEAADTLLKQQIEGQYAAQISDALRALGASMSESNGTLGDVVNLLQARLDEATRQQQEALAQSDEANAQALQQEVSRLAQEHEAEASRLQSRVAALADDLAALETAAAQREEALQEAVDHNDAAARSGDASTNKRVDSVAQRVTSLENVAKAGTTGGGSGSSGGAAAAGNGSISNGNASAAESADATESNDDGAMAAGEGDDAYETLEAGYTEGDHQLREEFARQSDSQASELSTLRTVVAVAVILAVLSVGANVVMMLRSRRQ